MNLPHTGSGGGFIRWATSSTPGVEVVPLKVLLMKIKNPGRVEGLTSAQISVVVSKLRLAMKDLPDPSVTLVGKKWKSPFLVLISCILSLRTKDETTLPASMRLFAKAKTPQEMLKLNVEEIEKLIYPVGFYRTKARTILGICRDLIDRFDAPRIFNLH